MKLNRLWLALLACFCSHAATPDMEVSWRTERKLRPKLGINCSGCSKPTTFQAGHGQAKL
jgi:hypothetical protein